MWSDLDFRRAIDYMWTVEKQEGVNVINAEATKFSWFNQESPFQVFKG